jgi:hypothetical protein
VKPTIAFTVSCLREKYLRQALDSWSQVRGIQDARLLFCLEPVSRFRRSAPGLPPEQVGGTSFPVAEFRDYIVRNFPGCWYHIHVNERRLGCFLNTESALDLAFTRNEAEFAILAEEDMVVSTDILEYFAWAQRYRTDLQAQAVCAHAFVSDGRSDQAVRTSWFSPLVWGTWRERWQDYIRPGWGGVPGNPDAWDAGLRARIIEDKMACIFPALSRSQHIGQVSTLTPGALAEYFYKASISQCFSPDYPPQEYRETPRGPELQLTV